MSVSGMTSSIVFVRFVLTFAESGAVTEPGWSRHGFPDAVPTRDPYGLPTLPGTSVAGALRAWVRRSLGEDVALRWFGHVTRGTNEKVASPVQVLGVVQAGDQGIEVVERRRTRIDRARGAADNRTLRHEQLLAPGTAFEVFVRLDQVVDPVEFADVVATWQPVLGRGATSGQGRCDVSDVHHGTIDLSTDDGLGVWLALDGPELVRTVATTPVQVGAVGERPTIRVPFTVRGPLHVGTGAPDDPSAEHQVARTWRRAGSPAIPASSWRGVIRSRIEFILRSVGAQACTDGRCGTCWTCKVFGHGGGLDEKAAGVGLRGRLRFTDAVLENVQVARRTHVAIDRFTGGASDGLLYVVEGVEHAASSLVIEPDEKLETEQLEAFRAMLRLVAEDLNDGVIGVGGHVTRGYGGVRLDVAVAEADGTLPSLAAARELVADRFAGGTEVV